MGVEGELEVEGEMIVGPRGEALRSLGKDLSLCNQISISKLARYCSGSVGGPYC